MENSNYFLEKWKFAYSLAKKGKLFRKARAVIFKDGKLLIIKVIWKNGKPDEYVFPGGGVDEGETIKETVIRESFEEYGAVIEPIKYLGKQYYSTILNYNNEDFVSKRVEYFYLCNCKSVISKKMGLDGEFDFDDRTQKKVELTLEDLKKIPPHKLGKISQNNYNKLIAFIEEINIKGKNKNEKSC